MKMTIKKPVNKSSVNKSISCSEITYQKAAECIQSAISVLGKAAINGDIKARESVANLSVVLFELK